MIDERAFLRVIEGIIERRVAMREYCRRQGGRVAMMVEKQLYDRTKLDEMELRLVYNTILVQGMDHGRQLAEEDAKRAKRSPPRKKRRSSRT